MGFGQWGVHEESIEWTQKVSDGYLEHPERTTNYCFNLEARKDGGIEVYLSRDARYDERDGRVLDFSISADEAPDFIAGLQAWIEQL